MKKLFCQKCGKELTIKFEIEGYMISNGKRNFELRCPEYRLLTADEIEEEDSKYGGMITGRRDNNHTYLYSSELKKFS